jgi:hypothetical protein
MKLIGGAAQYENIVRFCDLRSPDSILIALAERLR